jgi:hypothetical protein
MYYLGSISKLLNNSPIPKWARNFQKYHLTDEQYVQLMKFLDEFNPITMFKKGFFIQLSHIPYRKENYFIDRRYPNGLNQIDTDILKAIFDKKVEGKRVLLHSKQWIYFHYTLPMKFALEKTKKIRRLKEKTNLLYLIPY